MLMLPALFCHWRWRAGRELVGDAAEPSIRVVSEAARLHVDAGLRADPDAITVAWTTVMKIYAIT